MKVVILCGGRGTRLREETEFRPKPMVPIGGRPILWHIMKIYAHHGFREFVLCLGYKGEMIKDYFRNYLWNTCDTTLTLGRQPEVEFHNRHDEEDWKVTLAETGEGSMTAYRVRQIQKYVQGDDAFLLTYGDILVKPETYADMLERWRGGKFAGLVTVTGSEDVTKGGLFFFDQAFCLKHLVEKPNVAQLAELRQQGWLKPGETAWYNAGIYLFSPVLFTFTAQLQKSPRGEYELTDALTAMLAAGHQLAGLQIAGRWVDVRDPEVLASLQE